MAITEILEINGVASFYDVENDIFVISNGKDIVEINMKSNSVWVKDEKEETKAYLEWG